MTSRRPRRLLAAALVLAALGATAVFVHEHGSGAAAPGDRTQPAEARCSTTNTPTSSQGSHTPVKTVLNSLKLVSYYPANAAWTNMWTNWQPDEIGRDLCAIAGLGANAVRIMVQPTVFQYPAPSATMLDRLSTVVDLAAARGLRVQLTLFDWWSDYADFRDADTWATAVLSRFRDDTRIVFCELQNEIDPYNTSAIAWARHELPVVRAALRSVPVTVSVSGNSPVAALKQLKSALAGQSPDFYDMHYYGAAGAAYSAFSAARSAVAPAALFLGETGASSGSAASPAGDANQDLYLRTVEWAARRAGLPDAALWMYTDLVPSGVPVLSDPIAANQRYFGLVRADGTQKPAARSARALFAGRAISTAFGNTFDTAARGLPAGWQTTDSSGGRFAWDAGIGHAAPGSARMSDTAANANPIPAFYTTPVVQPIRAGETFRLSAWAAGLNATGTNRVAISWFAGGGTFVREDDSPALPQGYSPWTKLTVTGQTPPGAAYAEVRLQSDGNSGTVWFDDASFAPLN